MKDCYLTINANPVNAAWGGGNAWLNSFVKYIKKKGVKINYHLGPKTQCVFVFNFKSFYYKQFFFFKNKNNISFNIESLENFKKKNPLIPIITRVNDTDKARKSNFIDKNFERINKISEHVAFISDWTKKYYFTKKIKNKNFSTILIQADRGIFKLKNSYWYKKKSNIEIITHHWSSNYYHKGFDRYLNLDNLLYKKKIKNIKFTIIGNVPIETRGKWKVAKIIPPLHGKKLANKIRSADIYLTGSRHEAGGNHVAEAVSCGLPIIYYKDAGGLKELCKEFGFLATNDNILNIIDKIKKNYSYTVCKLKKNHYLNSDKNMNELYYNLLKRNMKI